MGTTYFHIGMILSTLGLSPQGFALGLYPKDLIPMEIFVHLYISMILPISSQCGTLVVYPTILPSNKGPPSLPSNRSFIRPLSMKHPESTTWLKSFLLFLGQLLFTVLGSGHVHEASGAHRLSNRADPWITSWLGAHHLLFGIPRIHPSWLTLRGLALIPLVRTMDTTYLHIGMILSTLGLSPQGFALGLYPKGLIPMEIFVHLYIPMILLISSQCGTLVVYPTFISSNQGLYRYKILYLFLELQKLILVISFQISLYI
jgi:hypothetical protein